MNICVHTSSGRRGEPEPHVFFVGTRRLIVAGILDRWNEHPHRYFEVSCEDGRRFLLRLDTDRKMWDLAGVFARKARPAKPPAAAGASAYGVQPLRWWTALRSIL